MEEDRYKLISFLSESSLTVLNVIAKRAGRKYIIKRKKYNEEKVNLKKLMQEASKSRI